MNRHLDKETLTAVVAGFEIDTVASEHLQDCVFCRRQVEVLRSPIDERRREIEAEAPDWEEHAASIMARVYEAGGEDLRVRPRRWVRSALAVAAGLVIAVAVGHYTVGDPVTTSEEIQIELILAEVDDVLANDDLPGFEALAEMVPDSEELVELVEGAL
ncbi:MAG: hypothetical protein GY906_20485 [bacterium]|nr:hypothetical protein [bacterium]